MSAVTQECPTCRSTGLVRHPLLAEDEALVCPHCMGRGWQPLKFRAFDPNARLPQVERVHRRFVDRSPDVTEAGHSPVMTLDEFKARFRILPS